MMLVLFFYYIIQYLTWFLFVAIGDNVEMLQGGYGVVFPVSEGESYGGDEDKDGAVARETDEGKEGY